MRFSKTEDKATELIVRVHLDSSDDAARFFGQYSDALELKYKKRADSYGGRIISSSKANRGSFSALPRERLFVSSRALTEKCSTS